MKLVQHTRHLDAPRRLTVEFHEPECLCSACAPDRLDGIAIGKMAAAGFGASFALLALFDPAGVAHTLASMFVSSW